MCSDIEVYKSALLHKTLMYFKLCSVSLNIICTKCCSVIKAGKKSRHVEWICSVIYTKTP